MHWFCDCHSPGNSGTRSTWPRMSSVTCIRRSWRPARRSGCVISVCVRSTRCGSRKATARGDGNIRRITRPTRRACRASSASTKGRSWAATRCCRERSQPLRRRLTLLAIESSDPDPVGGEPVFVGGQPVTRLNSAAFGHTVGSALGFAYLPAGARRAIGRGAVRAGAVAASAGTNRGGTLRPARPQAEGVAHADHRGSRNARQYSVLESCAHVRGNERVFDAHHHRGAHGYRPHRLGRRVVCVCRRRDRARVCAGSRRARSFDRSGAQTLLPSGSP